MSIRIKADNLFFYAFWGLLMFGKAFGLTSSDIIFQRLTWIAIAFVIVKLLLTTYSKRSFTTIAVLNIIGLLVWLFSGSTTVLLTTIAISSMENINFESVCRYSFWILAPLFFIRTTLAIVGILDIQERYFYNANSDIRIRYGLGYVHPNTAHFMLFIVFVLCVFTYKNRIKLYHFILMEIYNVFIYSYTNSRTGVIIITLFIILNILQLYKYPKIILYGILKNIANKAFIFTSIASIVIAQLFWRIDLLRSWGTFSSRFSTAFSVMENNSITLFGVPGITTDFGMINFLYSDGLIFFILFVVGYYFLLKRYNRQNDILFMIACCCYAIYCLAESYADSILMNITLLMFGEFIYNKKSSVTENAKDKSNNINKIYRNLPNI